MNNFRRRVTDSRKILVQFQRRNRSATRKVKRKRKRREKRQEDFERKHKEHTGAWNSVAPRKVYSTPLIYGVRVAVSTKHAKQLEEKHPNSITCGGYFCGNKTDLCRKVFVTLSLINTGQHCVRFKFVTMSPEFNIRRFLLNFSGNLVRNFRGVFSSICMSFV